MESDLGPRLASIPQTSRALNIGRTKTYSLIEEGRLETVTIGTRRLVTIASIDRLIQHGLEAARAARESDRAA